ncbi:hypothetical protein EYF80_018522 [Liparis tanakae]|uniref:Uncharacterized protein n=1 Tax=Liparis tanakae TaxID=230148 RepID=A0A4Z2I1L7_9TELE|nr:hypothetical protein EYF80_018522 [Liparis tanakae]
MSMEAVASSMMRMLLFLTKARARQKSCRWPRLKFSPPSVTTASEGDGDVEEPDAHNHFNIICRQSLHRPVTQTHRGYECVRGERSRGERSRGERRRGERRRGEETEDDLLGPVTCETKVRWGPSQSSHWGFNCSPHSWPGVVM